MAASASHWGTMAHWTGSYSSRNSMWPLATGMLLDSYGWGISKALCEW